MQRWTDIVARVYPSEYMAWAKGEGRHGRRKLSPHEPPGRRVLDGNEIVPHMKIVKLKAIPVGSSRTTYECTLVEGDEATGKTHFCVKVEQLTGYATTLQETESFRECLIWIKLSQSGWYDKIRKEWPEGFDRCLGLGFEIEGTDKGERTVRIDPGHRALADSTLLCPINNLFFGLYCGTDGVAVCLVVDAGLCQGFGDIAGTNNSALSNMLHVWNRLNRKARLEFRARLYFMTYVCGLRGMCGDFGMRNMYNQPQQHVLCAVNYGRSSEGMFDRQAIAKHLATRTEPVAYEAFCSVVLGVERPADKTEIRWELLRTRHLQILGGGLEDGRPRDLPSAGRGSGRSVPEAARQQRALAQQWQQERRERSRSLSRLQAERGWDADRIPFYFGSG